MAKRSGRGLLYFLARLLGDASAVSKGKSSRRLKRRLVGKAVGRSIMRWIFVIGLLIPLYQPGKPLLPVYYIDANDKGHIRVYAPDDLVIPKYVIKDGQLYEPDKPLLPKFEIRKFLNEGGQ